MQFLFSKNRPKKKAEKESAMWEYIQNYIFLEKFVF